MASGESSGMGRFSLILGTGDLCKPAGTFGRHCQTPNRRICGPVRVVSTGFFTPYFATTLKRGPYFASLDYYIDSTVGLSVGIAF